MSLLISGATLIDGVGGRPVEDQSIWIDGARIGAIGRSQELSVLPATLRIDASGKYVMPGLMDANVHLLLDVRIETLVRHEGRYAELIVEAAQMALKSGVTTVFDTWGPRAALIEARSAIASGMRPGSRIFCAGNIVGLDGPFSENFLTNAASVAGPQLVQDVNSAWAENVGPQLTWMSPNDVGREVRRYLSRGIDFIKYASSEHAVGMGPTALLAFSAEAQKAIVDEAHHAGLTAQAHTQSVEALRVAIEAGCEIIQHANITGPTEIPETTLELLVGKNVAATVFPLTQRRYEWIQREKNPMARRLWTEAAVKSNMRNLIRSGASLLLATDGGILCGASADPVLGTGASGEDNLFELGVGHFFWLDAMEEHGFPPMEMLKAATSNIARAYGQSRDLGTIEVGKKADLLILDRSPLEGARNYRSVHAVIKDGAVIDRSALPDRRLLTSDVGTSRPNAHYGQGLPFCCFPN